MQSKSPKSSHNLLQCFNVQLASPVGSCTLVPDWYKLYCFSYLQFSSVCAKALRRCLKPELRADALRREESIMKITKWRDGKPLKEFSKFSFVFIFYMHDILHMNLHPGFQWLLSIETLKWIAIHTKYMHMLGKW